MPIPAVIALVCFFRHAHGTGQRIFPQAGSRAHFVIEKFLECFERCKSVTVFATVLSVCRSWRPRSGVDDFRFGVAGWAGHSGIISILKKSTPWIKIVEEIIPPPLGGIFSHNFFHGVSAVKKLIFSIFFPIISQSCFSSSF